MMRPLPSADEIFHPFHFDDVDAELEAVDLEDVTNPLAAPLVRTLRALRAEQARTRSYQRVLREAMHTLHTVDAERLGLRRRNHDLLDQLREARRTAA